LFLDPTLVYWTAIQGQGMMSPDPPREERQSESEESTQISPDPMTIQTAWLDMDVTDELVFVPQGPHEMDMGGSESEYSSSDDEEDQSPPFRDRIDEPELPEGENFVGEGQVRGHYQLLIPFPAPVESADDLDSSQDFAEGQSSSHFSAENNLNQPIGVNAI